MDSDNQYWNKRFQEKINQYWNGDFRTIPVFMSELEENELGRFEYCSSGANCILLNKNAGLSLEEMEMIFMHEICHHIVWEKYGEVDLPHGKEWLEEMMKWREACQNNHQ